MSDYQARLKLAREAYQATRPDPAEVNAAVTRVGLQLSPATNQLRRLMYLLGGGALLAGLGLVGGGALSGGAQGGALSESSELAENSALSESGASSPSAGLLPVASPLNPAGQPIQSQPAGWLVPIAQGTTAGLDTSPGAEPPAVASRKLALPPGNGINPAEPPAPQANEAPAGWAAVSGALGRGDTNAASSILSELAASKDASTRAKALLGQAQIHLSKGERAEAKRLAAAAASVPGASEAIRMKAVRWAARASL